MRRLSTTLAVLMVLLGWTAQAEAFGRKGKSKGGRCGGGQARMSGCGQQARPCAPSVFSCAPGTTVVYYRVVCTTTVVQRSVVGQAPARSGVVIVPAPPVAPPPDKGKAKGPDKKGKGPDGDEAVLFHFVR